MKNLFQTIIFFLLVITGVGCNSSDEPEYTELRTEFVDSCDAPDEEANTFDGRWVDDYYLCDVTTIYLRSFEKVTSVYASYSDDDRKLVIHINTDLDSFPVDLDRKAKITFKLFGIPRKDYELVVYVGSNQLNLTPGWWNFN